MTTEKNEKKPLDEAKTSRVLADVLEERRRQHEKWGEQNLPDDSPAVAGLISRSAAWARDEIKRAIWWDQQPTKERERAWSTTALHLAWPLVLFEEVAEALEEAALTGTFDEPRGDPNQAALRLRAELVQVAAVAVQWIEAIDRRHMQQQMDEAHERSLASLPPHQQAFARIYEEAHRNQAALERHFGPPPRVQVCPPPGQVVAMDFPKFEHGEPLKVGPLEVVALGLDTGPESFTVRQEVPVAEARFVPEKDDREIIALPEGGSAEAFKRSREESRRDIRCERPTTLDGFDDIEYSVGGLTDPEGGEP